MDTLSAFDYKKTDDPDTTTIEFPSYLSVLEKMEQNDVSMPFLLAPGKISSNKQRKQQTKKYPLFSKRVFSFQLAGFPVHSFGTKAEALHQ